MVVNVADEYKGTVRNDVQVIIYRKGTIFDTEITRFTVEAGKTKTYDLSYYQADKKYFIEFNGAPFRVTLGEISEELKNRSMSEIKICHKS